MNTDNKPDKPSATPQANSGQSDSSGQALVDLVNTMDSVDTTTPEARANETSMDDNKGGRIEYTDDDTDKPDSLTK